MLLKDGTRSVGMRSDGLVQTAGSTAVCSLMLDGTGNLVSGVAAMDITRDFKADTVSIPTAEVLCGVLNLRADC